MEVHIKVTLIAEQIAISGTYFHIRLVYFVLILASGREEVSIT